MRQKILIALLGVVLVAAGVTFFTRETGEEVAATQSVAAPARPLAKTAEDYLSTEKGNIRQASPEKATATKSTETKVSKTQADPCLSLPYDSLLSCYITYFNGIVATDSIPAAFTELKSKFATTAFVQRECHQIVHGIGRAAIKKLGTVSAAFAQGDPVCWSGYFHGVMEGYSQKFGIPSFAEGKIDEICKDIPGKSSYSFGYYNCVHGLGHGIMSIKNNNLFESLTLCDNLAGGWEESSCAGGVFMENVIADGRDHKTTYLKPEDPLYPCNAVDTKFKSTCYLMQSSYMLKVSNWDFTKVFALCASVESSYIDTCYQSLGRDASGQSLNLAPGTKQKCLLGRDYREQSNCIVGAVKDFVSYYHGDKEALVLCETLPSELVPLCRETTTNYYKTF